MAVTKRTRYEVLKRDNHACRYCGAGAPEAKLTIDHVVPVALGGTDSPENLVAACHDCNAGKSSVPADAALVADVAADALQWRKAIEVAAEMAQRDRDAQAALLDTFHEYWSSFTYSYSGKPIDLPIDWRTKVAEQLNAGLTGTDIKEAVEVTMAARNVRDEFWYFLGVCKQVNARRQAVAQELIRHGLVE